MLIFYLNLVLICFNPLYKHPCLVGKGRASNSSSFLLPVVLSDPVGFIFLPNADFCSLVVTVGCLSGGIKNVYWGFCHNASSLVFIFLMTREVDDLWVFIELDRSGFVGAAVSVSYLILLHRYGIWADLQLQQRTSGRMLGLLCWKRDLKGVLYSAGNLFLHLQIYLWSSTLLSILTFVGFLRHPKTSCLGYVVLPNVLW